MTREELLKIARRLLSECQKLEGKELEPKKAEYDKTIAAIKQFDELAALDTPATPAPAVEGRTPRIEVVEGDRELETHFLAALKGLTIPDQARDRFVHHNPGFKKAGADAFLVPKSMAKHFILPRVLEQIEGRVIPSVSTDDPGPANTFQIPLGPVLHAEAEPVRLMEMVTSIPTPLGGIKFPRIVQTDANEYGAIEVCWGEEAGEKDATQLQIEQVPLVTHEVQAYTEVSDTALRRSAIFEPWLTRLFREATADGVEDTIAGGNGVTQPEGIAIADIRDVLRAGAGITYADLVNLKYKLRWNHRARGVFVIQDDGLRTLELTQGAVDNKPLFTPNTSAGIYPQLVGKSFVGSHRMPAVGVEGDVVFMDPACYALAVETDIVVRRSEHYKFRNNVTAFAVFMLVGGRVVLPRLAAKLSKAGATTTSPGV